LPRSFGSIPAFSGGLFCNFGSKPSRPVGTGQVRLQICEGGILRSIAIDDLDPKAAQLAYGRPPSTAFWQGLDQNSPLSANSASAEPAQLSSL
jgi:hypothetical protein